MPRKSKYDAATRERAVRMYFERLDEGGISKIAVRREIGELLDVKETTLRTGSAHTKSRKTHLQTRR